jgi:D-3-phosphoglycerate dehydrogenase
MGPGWQKLKNDKRKRVKSMKKIVLSHALYKPGMDALKGKADVVITNNGHSNEIINELKEADGFILRVGSIDRKAIEQCPNLKVITRPGVGYDNVDVKAATEYGIPVVVTPPVNSRAVAEHTIALLFAVAKNIVESANETRKGNYNIRNKYAAVDIINKTITILGFGHIGREVASMCSALGMKVAVYDPFVQKEAVEAKGYIYFDNLNNAISAGDFITIHMPSLPSTKNLISNEQFAAMKPTAFLLNSARGDIVDEEQLTLAVKEGRIAGAGLDVLTLDPPSYDNPLLSFPNVTYTPHSAAQTQETTSRIACLAVEGTLAVLNGEKWDYVANKEVYNHPRWR